MVEMRYARVLERYLFGGAALPTPTLPSEGMDIGWLQPGVLTAWTGALGRELPLVLRLTASGRRCVILLDPALKEYTAKISRLPVNPAALAEGRADHTLRDICTPTFGDAASVYVYGGLVHYCTARSLRRFSLPGVVRVTRRNVEEIIASLRHGGVADDPGYILKHGPAYAFYADGKPRGFAGVHRSRMTDRVGNVGMVFVEEAYRGRGVAKALVSAVAAGLLAAGRVPMYGCSADNQASAGVAGAVGFLLRGYRCRVTISPRHTEGHKGAWRSRLRGC